MTGVALRIVLGCTGLVTNDEPHPLSVELGNTESLLRHVDARGVITQARDGFRQNSSAAANIQRWTRPSSFVLNVAQTARIDVVQRFEVTIGIPPAMGQIIELFNFLLGLRCRARS